MSDYVIVKSPVANIYKSHTFTSELVTQALIWEELIVLDKKNNWYKIQQQDGYIGWTHKFYIINSDIYDSNKSLQNKNNWYWIKDRLTSIRLMDSSEVLISFGSLLPCFDSGKSFYTIFPNGEKGSLNKKSVLQYKANHSLENIITYSMKLIGTPYLWGGKSSYGYDCSGLIQIIYNIAGYKFPRDCSMQIKSNLLKEISKDYIKKGDLVYFSNEDSINHVGVFINENKFLHSSGHIKINSINKNDIDFNNKLYNMLHGYYSVN